jgi:hypothetical protein
MYLLQKPSLEILNNGKDKENKKRCGCTYSKRYLKVYVANNSDDNIYNMSPLQMIPNKEKDEDWKKWNLDWLERAGIRQLNERESRKLIKNYHLANGILDKS